MLRQARRGHQRGGILFDVTGARQPLEPASNGGRGAGGRGLAETMIVERAQIGPDMRVLDAFDGLPLAVPLGNEGREGVQFALVGAQRVCRGATLISEYAQVL